MNNYQRMINRVREVICTNIHKGQNYVLIGENSSGKSEILHTVLTIEQENAIYFIDSVNRTFDADKVEFFSKSYENAKMNSQSVVSVRLEPNNFNLQDTFSAMTCIEQLYDKYKSEISELCSILLECDIEIIRESIGAGLTENKVLIDGVDSKLSSGYQAVIRLICELLYFKDVMKTQKWEKGFVVIDEIDEYLSPNYSSRILNFLQEQFSEMDFLVTTHSIDLVKHSKNICLIILKNSDYEIFSNENIQEENVVDTIFTNLFFDAQMIHHSNDDDIDEKLRLLLNLKIADMWDDKAQNELEYMASVDMKPHHRMIYNQIREW